MREIEKQRELRKSEIDSQLNSEVRKLESSITLSVKQAEEAHAQAAAELARTEVILAQEKVQTDRERAVADRSLEMAVKRVKEAGEVAEANAATEVTVLLKRAKAEAEATHTRAAAEKARMLAESEGSRALIDAENALSTPVLHMKLEQYRLDRLPEIMSHMMKPIEKIDSIRINHVSGFGATNGAGAGGAAGSSDGGGGAGKPPVTQVMDSILGMALQLPALKSIGDQIGVDLSGSIDAAAGKPSPGAGKA
jgi:flotillin